MNADIILAGLDIARELIRAANKKWGKSGPKSYNDLEGLLNEEMNKAKGNKKRMLEIEEAIIHVAIRLPEESRKRIANKVNEVP